MDTKSLRIIRRNAAPQEYRWLADVVLRLNDLGWIDDYDTMDCFQEVASKLPVYVASWREGRGSSLESWVRTSAKRDALRHAAKLEDSGTGYVDDPGFDANDDEVFTHRAEAVPVAAEALDAVDDERAMARLQSAVRDLPEGDRDVVLARLAGASLQEIADERGVSKQRVSRILARAERKIRSVVLDKSSE